jgi:hypothetical protein
MKNMKKYASLIAMTTMEKYGLNPTGTCLNSLLTRCADVYEYDNHIAKKDGDTFQTFEKQ